jgi:hypothetical protein
MKRYIALISTSLLINVQARDPVNRYFKGYYYNAEKDCTTILDFKNAHQNIGLSSDPKVYPSKASFTDYTWKGE